MTGLGLLSAIAVSAGFGLANAQVQSKAEASHPDFTGVWTSYRDPSAPPRAARPAAPPAGAPAAAASATGAARSPRGDISALPLTEAAKTKIAEYRAMVGASGDAPGAHCVGTGLPGSMEGSGGYPMEILQRPEQINIVYEAHAETRRIYLGNRIIPEADRLPDRNGVSSARWEGETLVVEVTDLKEQVDQRHAHSDQARITERYHLEKDSAGGRVLVSDWTMTDPFYTAPVKGQKKWSEVPNGHLLPYDCPEQGWLEHLEELRNPNAPKSKYY
ncbi:MAG: hypothetical protein Q8R02_15550 [Hyphomonadaceae bacterium]|nr:hypothetical protein [Hyphomonadaceae bacterium]